MQGQGRRELGDIKSALARDTFGWPQTSKVRWLLWKMSLGCGSSAKDEWAREGPGCLEPVVGYVKSEKGKKVCFEAPEQWDGRWEACNLEIDTTQYILYTSLSSVREEWAGWDCTWCEPDSARKPSGGGRSPPIKRERSLAFKSP